MMRDAWYSGGGPPFTGNRLGFGSGILQDFLLMSSRWSRAATDAEFRQEFGPQ